LGNKAFGSIIGFALETFEGSEEFKAQLVKNIQEEASLLSID